MWIRGERRNLIRGLAFPDQEAFGRIRTAGEQGRFRPRRKGSRKGIQPSCTVGGESTSPTDYCARSQSACRVVLPCAAMRPAPIYGLALTAMRTPRMVGGSAYGTTGPST